ncbi:MAG: CsgG/HfaB family protein [Thermovirgaceae bacterium]|nr:CsgG/HfaB family protein [Thermovirgaceae bacterium]
MKKGIFGLIMFAFVFSAICVGPAFAKTRIAVIDFEDAAGSGAPARAITDMLVTELFNTNLFTIIERSKIDSLLFEQNMVISGAIDASSAVKLGKLLGVELLITGSITEFRNEVAGGAIPIPGLPAGIAIGSRTGYVTIDLRAIDAQTGEIRMVAREQGASNQTLGGVAYDGAVFGGGKIGGVMAGATHKAVLNLVEKLKELPSSLPARSDTFNVIQTNGAQVMVDAGSSNSDLTPGTFLAAYREGATITAMDGTVLDAEKIYLSILSVVEMKPNYCVCSIIRGIPLARGDKVETLGDRSPDAIILGSR